MTLLEQLKDLGFSSFSWGGEEITLYIPHRGEPFRQGEFTKDSETWELYETLREIMVQYVGSNAEPEPEQLTW